MAKVPGHPTPGHIAEASSPELIFAWGDSLQARSFLGSPPDVRRHRLNAFERALTTTQEMIPKPGSVPSRPLGQRSEKTPFLRVGG